jgi:ACS family hexuronate transporter-like MFS transporter
MHAKRSRLWVWWICGILFFASMINYMDRLTLSNCSVPISDELHLNDEQYGRMEFSFGMCFAVGAVLWGTIADHASIRWLYPCVLFFWSAMGFSGSFAQSFRDLLVCRMLLGFFEGGHFPCALRTTQGLLPPSNRAFGNSILQGGLAFGSILTPQLIRAMGGDAPGAWRPVFQVIGVLGAVWVVLWLLSVRRGDVDAPPSSPESIEQGPGIFELMASRRYLALVVIVVVINIAWHVFRVWLPKFLERGRGYSFDTTQNLQTTFSCVAEVGCLGAGFATALLARRGMSVHGSRTLVFASCGVIVLAGAAIHWLSAGPLLLAAVLAAGFGAAGMFPCYYAFSQDLTRTHQGKLTGSLSFFAWTIPSTWHWCMGMLADATHSYDWGIALGCLMPLLGIAAIFLIWPREQPSIESSSPTEVPSDAVVPAERVTGIH